MLNQRSPAADCPLCTVHSPSPSVVQFGDDRSLTKLSWTCVEQTAGCHKQATTRRRRRSRRLYKSIRDQGVLLAVPNVLCFLWLASGDGAAAVSRQEASGSLVLTHYVTLGLRFCRLGIGNHRGVNYSHISIHGVCFVCAYASCLVVIAIAALSRPGRRRCAMEMLLAMMRSRRNHIKLYWPCRCTCIPTRSDFTAAWIHLARRRVSLVLV